MRNLPKIALVVGFLLCIPLIAMQFTDQVNWSFFDFLIMGVLLFLTGMIINLIVIKVQHIRSRILYVAVIVVLFLLTWAELTVGIFGTPFAGS